MFKGNGWKTLSEGYLLTASFIQSESCHWFIFAREQIPALGIIQNRLYPVRYFLHLTYKGSHFHGWQRQRNAPSVQESLESACSTLLKCETEVIGCGRTDTGVHAHSFYAHFDHEAALDNTLLYPLNALLPEDIAVHDIIQVDVEMHARYSATARTYKYFIHSRKDPFLADRSYFFRHADGLDLEKMNAFGAALPRFQDFSSFEKVGSNNKHSFCSVYSAEWSVTADGLVFTISANRFLRNMVRAIVATSLMIGIGKVSLEEVLKQIERKERIHLYLTAPAHGLHLWDIRYPSLPSTSDE